jgi:hypothetical protein
MKQVASDAWGTSEIIYALKFVGSYDRTQRTMGTFITYENVWYLISPMYFGLIDFTVRIKWNTRLKCVTKLCGTFICRSFPLAVIKDKK